MLNATITIAGRTWHVPLLAPRQNRIVIPALMKLGTNADYALLLDIVVAALGRAYTACEIAGLEDEPVPLYELADAIAIVAQQTGFLAPSNGTQANTAPPDFDALIAEFVNFLPGTTPDYWEDALTAQRLTAMREEWRKHPPLAVLAAAWLGYRPQARDDNALAELLRLFPDGRLRLN